MRKGAGVAAWAALLFWVPTWAQGPVPVGELFASDANGQRSLQLAGSGMNVVSGSELAAGIAPATLKLFRGGEVRICPHSGLSVNAGGQGLTLATGSGSLEVDYQLSQEAVDILITPDFNITLAGPGKFHFALGVNKKGDTCVKPLPGHASEIMLSEQLGTGSYKAKGDEAVVFPEGKLEQHRVLSGECGCPAPAAVLRAEAQPAPTPPQENKENARPAERVMVATNNPTSATPPDHPGEVHVQVDAPFVFSARPSAARPYSVARLQVSTLPNVFFVQEQVDPVVLKEKPPEVSLKAEAQQPRPAEKPKMEKKGFLGRIKGFFGSIFHR